MLGWMISFYRLPTGQSAETMDVGKETPLAQWEVGFDGIDGLDELVKQGKATQSRWDGYPNVYTTTAEYALPMIASGPPMYAGPTIFGDDYVMPTGWNGPEKMNQDLIAACAAHETIVVIAWDLS
jgi:hypothetical protein